MTITTRKQIEVPTFYHFMGIPALKVKTGTRMEWRNVDIKLDANEACHSVLTIAQYAEVVAHKRAMKKLVAIALQAGASVA